MEKTKEVVQKQDVMDGSPSFLVRLKNGKNSLIPYNADVAKAVQENAAYFAELNKNRALSKKKARWV